MGRRASSRPRSRSPEVGAGRRASTASRSPPRAITIPFISMPSTNASTIASCVGDSRSASPRSRSRSPALSTRKTARWPPESTGLRTAGSPDAASADVASSVERTVANGGCGTPASARALAHRQLVRHPVSGIDSDSREPQLARPPRRRPEPRGRPRPSTPRRRDAAGRPRSPRDIGEVDDLGDVGRGESGRLGVAVDRDDSQVLALAHARSRGAGGAPRRRRGRSSRPPMLTSLRRRQEPGREPVPALDVAAVRQVERRPHAPPGDDADDARAVRAAVDLGADRRARDGREELSAARGELAARDAWAARPFRATGSQRSVQVFLPLSTSPRSAST